MTFLLDTNVVSETSASRRLPKPVADWCNAVDPIAMIVSVATLLEIEVGVRRLERRDPRQGAVLRRWKTQSLSPAFRGRVLPVDEDVADCCAAMQVPDPRPLLDSIIAATAIVYKAGPGHPQRFRFRAPLGLRVQSVGCDDDLIPPGERAQRARVGVAQKAAAVGRRNSASPYRRRVLDAA